MSVSKEKPLLETFRSLDSARKEALADLDGPLTLAFAALYLAKEHCNIDRLSAEHIVACLEAAGVAVSRTTIASALKRAGTRISRQANLSDETLFRLMTKGEREITPLLNKGAIEIVRVDGSRPRTARVQLTEILSAARGIVRICDPYYGFRTLDVLEAIPAKTTVQFLSAKTNEAGRKLSAAIRDFKTERPNIEFRITDRPHELHDRYLVTNDQMLLVGHGFKDIGNRESFMIRIDKTWAPDLLKETTAAFDLRWNRATTL